MDFCGICYVLPQLYTFYSQKMSNQYILEFNKNNSHFNFSQYLSKPNEKHPSFLAASFSPELNTGWMLNGESESTQSLI